MTTSKGRRQAGDDDAGTRDGEQRPDGAGGNDADPPSDLDGMLERMTVAAEGTEQVSVGDVYDVIGHRSFGPLLLVPGLVTLAPLVGDIPGVPVLMGLVVVLTCAQLLFGRKSFWLPKWLLERRVDAEKFAKATGWLRKPARCIDRLLKPRLEILVGRAGMYGIAATCVGVALLTPAMELVPFSALGAGVVLTAFGLALIACDGVFALLGFVVAGGIFAVLAWQLL